MRSCVGDKVQRLFLYIVRRRPYSAGCVLALALSLMHFPCVLERQTQLHFNDTQMLLGFKMCACVCVRARSCVCLRMQVLFDHYSENPVVVSLCVTTPHFACMCVHVSVHVSVSSESHEGLSGISEHLYGCH